MLPVSDLSSPHLRTLILIVNYQKPALTIGCLQSLVPQLRDEAQVLVVDNGSKDESVAQIRAAFPGIAIDVLPENSGFTGGFNAAIAHALQTSAQWIVLSNNDILFEADAIAQLTGSSKWDITVPKIVYADEPEVLWAAGARWRTFPPGVVIRGFGKPDAPQYNHPMALEYATACVLAARREVFAAIGGFDADYTYYMEDYDFCYRARAAGFRMGYVPAVRVKHKVSQTLGERSAQKYRFLGRNTVLFYRKDKRFSLAALGAYCAWFSLREIVSGRWTLVRAFWGGVRMGVVFLQKRDRVRNG